MEATSTSSTSSPTSPASPVRTVAGVELPAPGTWRIDPGHAEVGFVGRHFGLTKVRGRFTGVSGDVVVAEDVAGSSVAVEIDMATVSSGDDARDEHLRSADLFDVAAHPTATFRSTALRAEGASGELDGELTIKGVTRPVTLDVDYLGHAHDPWGNDRAVFSASTTVDREDWGLTWNMLLDTGGLLVSKRIRLEIEVELIRQEA
jgi:polyisoprenoid-binding protein YceI